MASTFRSGLFLLLLFMAGCATITGVPKAHDVPARVYELDSGMTINATFESLSEGHGRITGQGSDGEQFSGEFSIDSQMFPMGYRPPIFTTMSAGSAERYGFTPGSDVRPVGSATLLGDRGTVVEIVLYSIHLLDGYGAGVATDNKDRVYRVHIGDL